jgi:hypothetical protein
MGGLVFLPAYPELNRRSLARLVAVIQTSASTPRPEIPFRRLRQA